jgi:hypothetical protein
MDSIKRELHAEAAEGDEEMERQDKFVVFTTEKELKHHETIRQKAKFYTGIVVKMRTMTATMMDHLLKAVDADNRLAEEAVEEETQGGKIMVKQSGEVFDRIQHLRFEDVRLASKCVKSLASWMKMKPYLRSISLAHL